MNANDDLRKRIRDELARTGTYAATVSQAVGFSKDFLRDFLKGRKTSIAHDKGLSILEHLSHLPTIGGPADNRQVINDKPIATPIREPSLVNRNVNEENLRRILELVFRSFLARDEAVDLADTVVECLAKPPLDAVGGDVVRSFEIHFELEGRKLVPSDTQ